MDENEITTVADTQAENTADTADTGQTVEEQLAAMAERITALESIVGEDEYELRYSGEQVDELLDGANSIFKSKTVSQIIALMSRSFPLVMKFGKVTKNLQVKNNTTHWWWNDGVCTLPAMTSQPYIFVCCDWGGAHYKSAQVHYEVIDNKLRIDHQIITKDDSAGTKTFTTYYLIIGKNTGGGQIG